MSRLKNAYKSKTIIFNTLLAALAALMPVLNNALPELHGQLSNEIYQGLLLFAAVGNAGLRAVTTQDLADK